MFVAISMEDKLLVVELSLISESQTLVMTELIYQHFLVRNSLL